MQHVSLFVSIALALPMAYLAIVSLYLAVMAFGAWRFRKRADPGAPPLRFALLVPAHNEEHHLGDLLSGVQRLDYPADRVAVFVICDNCGDRTAAIAREHGAAAWERHDPAHPGKGQALDWALRTHRAELEAHDAIAMVDADMHIDPAFLRELSASLSAPGVEVVQGLNTVARPERNWRTALGYLGFMVINHVRPAGRNWLGGTAELKGSGMAFRSPRLLRYGWPAHSLAEDAEFAKRLFLDGIPVHYNPDALVTSEIPVRIEQARVQQARWEGGKRILFRTYLPIFLRRALARPGLANLDALLDLLVPPLSLLAALWCICFAGAWLAGPAWIALTAACGAAIAACVLSGLVLRPAPPGVWKYLAAAPLLVAWKLPMLLRLTFQRGHAPWRRTPRDPELR